MKPIRGFTLIELVMSIAIVGILLTVGIPSFRQLITDNRIVTQTNDFVSALAHARAEAVRRNTRGHDLQGAIPAQAPPKLRPFQQLDGWLDRFYRPGWFWHARCRRDHFACT